MQPLLQIDNLRCEVSTDSGPKTVVDDVSLTLGAGETLGLVGESGCGKSMTALALMHLLPQPGGRISNGSIRFEGINIAGLPTAAVTAMRGSQMAMIFQDPMTALNPVHRIGKQISECLSLHAVARFPDTTSRNAEAVKLLQEVGMPEPAERMEYYPHQLSGGQRQRVMIAMALACQPKLLIADEPTTALDVTVQAEIMALIKALQQSRNMAMLFITHDLELVRDTCDHIAIMYAGRIVECGSIGAVFTSPRHPYTRALLDSRPGGRARKSLIPSVPGQVPQVFGTAEQCRFADRCAHATAQCHSASPAAEHDEAGRMVACLRWRELSL